MSIVIAARNEARAPAGAHRQPARTRLPRRPARDYCRVRRFDRRHARCPVSASRRPSRRRVPGARQGVGAQSWRGPRHRRRPRLRRRAPDVRAGCAPRAGRAACRSVGRRRHRRADSRLRGHRRAGPARVDPARARAVGSPRMRPRARPPRVASAEGRRPPRSATASVCTGATRSNSGGSRAPSAPRSGRPAPFTRSADRSYRPLPPDTILDDVLTPMRAVLAGYRDGVQRTRGRLRSRRPWTRRPSAAGRSARLPATSRSLARSRGCSFRSSTPSGCSTCRTSSAGCSSRTRCSSCSRQIRARVRQRVLFADIGRRRASCICWPRMARGSTLAGAFELEVAPAAGPCRPAGARRLHLHGHELLGRGRPGVGAHEAARMAMPSSTSGWRSDGGFAANPVSSPAPADTARRRSLRSLEPATGDISGCSRSRPC